MHFVAEPVGEVRAQGAVHQATNQDGGLAGAAFTTEERTWDLAGGVHALFDVDGEREERSSLSCLLGAGGGHQHFGAAHAGDNCTASKSGHAARFE